MQLKRIHSSFRLCFRKVFKHVLFFKYVLSPLTLVGFKLIQNRDCFLNEPLGLD